VNIADIYSEQEVGYIALQFPDYPYYHVQPENILVEVLDDNGNVCSSGDIGRVVITTLHNFTTPLIRYEIMDYAKVGEPCSCGRGLPVLLQYKLSEESVIFLYGLMEKGSGPVFRLRTGPVLHLSDRFR
jgi:phenylacetate-coenzyme A ligase PaaK-like adenylate-forming protein